MKKTCLFAATLLCGCSLVKMNSDNIPSEKEQVNLETGVFCSAVVFPEGYDWRKDSGQSVQDGKLMLICSDRILCELEGRDPLSPHFLVKGRLYDCICSGGKTLVRCNGEKVLEWDGEAQVWDLALDGSDLVCLCCDDDGTRLVREGVTVGRWPGCWPESDFYDDDGRLCFDLGGKRSGIVRDGVAQLWETGQLGEMQNAHFHSAGGMTWFRGESSGTHLYGNYEEGPKAVSHGSVFTGIVYGGANVWMEAYSGSRYQLWQGGEAVFTTEVPFERTAVAVENDDIYVLGKLQEDQWAILHDGNFTMLPEGSRPVAGAGMALRYGRLMLPLALQDGNAAIWDKGKVSGLGINGYVDRISIGRGSSQKFYLSR